MISGLFLVTSFLVIATPGPDSALVVRLVLRTGRRAPAAAAACGMISAGVMHATLALTGVSVALLADPALLVVVRILGAAVMLVWGLKALRNVIRLRPSSSPATERDGPEAPAGLRRSFVLGFLCTASNPKVGLFLLAYLPQFIPAGAPVARSMAVLAGFYLCLVALWLGSLVTVVRVLHRRVLARRDGARGGTLGMRLAEGVMAAVFIGFAVRLGWSG